jgi:Domain of unknown function (DUF4160)
MPTIHREGGFRFIIYVDDHFPAHIHAVNSDGQVIIRLGNQTQPPTIDRIHGVRDKDIGKALAIARVNQQLFLEAWRKTHG